MPGGSWGTTTTSVALTNVGRQLFPRRESNRETAAIRDLALGKGHGFNQRFNMKLTKDYYPLLVHVPDSGSIYVLPKDRYAADVDLPDNVRVLRMKFNGEIEDLFPLIVSYEGVVGTKYVKSINKLDLTKGFAIVATKWDSVDDDNVDIPNWQTRAAGLDLIPPIGCEGWIGREFYPFKPEVNYSPITMTEALFMEMGSLSKVRVIGFPKMVQGGKIPVFTMVRYCFVEDKLNVNHSFCSTIGEFKERFRPVV